MGKILKLVGILAGVVMTVTSCLNSDDTKITFYNDAVITNFYIATAEVEKHTTSSTGEDSVYTTTNTDVAKITFQIDHYNGRIYNLDSLPYGTNAAKLLCSYSTKSNGMLAIRNLETEEEEDGEEWKYFSMTDSIDFTVPRTVKVFAYNDNEITREYTIEVNVKQIPEMAMVWQNVGTLDELAAMQNARLLACGDNVVLLASDGNSTTIYRNNDNEFEKVTNKGAANLYANAATYGNSMAMLNGTNIEYMQNGMTTTETYPADGIRQLLAMSRSHIYAMDNNGRIVISKDHGATWQEDVLDDDASLLPDQGLAAISVPYLRDKNVDNTVLIGTSSTKEQDYMVSWLKIDIGDGNDGKWALMTNNDESSYLLPKLSRLSMTAANSGLLLATGINTEGKYETMYISRDGGLTWKQNDNYTLPEISDGVTEIALCMDNANRLWLVCCGTGEIWRCDMSE